MENIIPPVKCPECKSTAPAAGQYKGIQLYECEECQNHFGFISKADEKESLLKEVA